MNDKRPSVATSPESVWAAIARNLCEFGYPDVTASMIREVHEAMNAGDPELPHGVIGAFAREQIAEAQAHGMLR
jgi:hypothetical protein